MHGATIKISNFSLFATEKRFFARNCCSHGYVYMVRYNSATDIFYFYVDIICTVIRTFLKVIWFYVLLDRDRYALSLFRGIQF